MRRHSIRVFVITGVAGSGKSTVGRAAADALGWRFHDADDLHSPEAVQQMRRGVPLNDEQRLPWLLRVRAVIEQAVRDHQPAIVACSALKDRYRHVLADGLEGVEFVFLHADRPLLEARLKRRQNHFAGLSLLDSQLEALEPPTDALVIDAALPVDAIVDVLITRSRA